MPWLLSAAASALFAGLTSVLVKCGVRTLVADLATAIRTTVVLALAWLMVDIVGSAGQITALTTENWLFLGLSGLATGGSWICYFKALSTGDVNKVVPIDKSSTVLAALLAIVLFGETSHLAVKLAGTAVVGAGTLLMVERGRRAPASPQGADEAGRGWLVYAVLAAVFAALTSILAKFGIEGVESNLATAIRTCFVLVMAWAVAVGRGKLSRLRDIDRRELAFVCASGLATGASWLFYYHAVQTGQVSVVVQVDKLSILVSVAFARAVFKERLSPRAACGLALIVAGTAAMALWS